MLSVGMNGCLGLSFSGGAERLSKLCEHRIIDGNLTYKLNEVKEVRRPMRPPSYQFEHLLLTTRNRQASNIWDKIFVLLNPIPLRYRPDIEVDYRSDLDDVFADATRACSEASASLDILRLANLQRRG